MWVLDLLVVTEMFHKYLELKMFKINFINWFYPSSNIYLFLHSLSELPSLPNEKPGSHFIFHAFATSLVLWYFLSPPTQLDTIDDSSLKYVWNLSFFLNHVSHFCDPHWTGKLYKVEDFSLCFSPFQHLKVYKTCLKYLVSFVAMY